MEHEIFDMATSLPHTIRLVHVLWRRMRYDFVEMTGFFFDDLVSGQGPANLGTIPTFH